MNDGTKKLAAVIHENNKLRKENERLRGVEAENARLRVEVYKEMCVSGNAWQRAMHWKGRDDARGKAMPTLLANEWNAAIEAAAMVLKNARDSGKWDDWVEDVFEGFEDSIRAIKREAK